MNELVGKFEIPLTGRELLTALRDGKPAQIGRPFLVKALQLVEECAESVIDVQTKGDKAFLTPERFRLNKIGEQCIANNSMSLGAEPQAERRSAPCIGCAPRSVSDASEGSP